jgi:hypothetical protein
MPTTTADKPPPDMTRTWAGRDRATARRQAERAIAVLIAQGKTVVVIEPDGRSQTFHP